MAELTTSKRVYNIQYSKKIYLPNQKFIVRLKLIDIHTKQNAILMKSRLLTSEMKIHIHTIIFLIHYPLKVVANLRGPLFGPSQK